MRLLNSKATQELFSDPFEQTLLKSAYSCLHNLNDPLRCNLFALVLRELVRITMDRLAPETKVIQAPWYNSKKITRADRYRFALTGNLADKIIAKYPDLDTSDEQRNLKDTSDELSKYAHISPNTYNLDSAGAQQFSDKIETDVLQFATAMIDLRKEIEDTLHDLVKSKIFDRLYNNMGELDELSSQTFLDGVADIEIGSVDLTGDLPLICGWGSAEVELTYGRGDDGFSTPDAYPLKFEAEVDLELEEIVHIRVQVDTRSFYE